MPTLTYLGVSMNTHMEVSHAIQPALAHKDGRLVEADDQHLAGTGHPGDIGCRALARRSRCSAKIASSSLWAWRLPTATIRRDNNLCFRGMPWL
jgi:hypothetical protein